MRRRRLAWAEKGWSTRTRRRPSFSSRGHGRGERETEDEEGECGVEWRVLVLDLSTARWQRGHGRWQRVHGRWQRVQRRRATRREQPAR
jgi:hypothetical protein